MAREQGVKPYNSNETFEDPGITDKELEEFLQWRQREKQTGRELQEKEWLS